MDLLFFLGFFASTCSLALPSPSLVAGDPYKDVLASPSFKPKPEVIPNKTIDQLIVDAYGGLRIYMNDNFLDLRGDITAELDMVLTSEQFKSLYMAEESESGTRYKRKATRPVVLRWKDKTVPYEFVTSHFNADEVYYIKAAMARWEETTCIRFRPFTGNDPNRIRFQNGNGCNSLLGMSRGVQPINLQAPGCRYSGLYLHEIGHAIGLVHEHQLPDRDQFIYVIYDNVAPSMRIWFNKYSPDDVNQYGVPYEYSSVMHYGVTAFSKDGSSQTIKSKDASREAEIGRVYLKGLSFTDIKVVNLMYECNKHCAQDPSCVEPAYLDKTCKCVKPEAGSGATTSRPTGGCSNNWDDAQCGGWAREGECDANPIWMRENCRKSCQACQGVVTEKPDPAGCDNVWGDSKCDGWADEGECEANPIWMKENCKKACRDCSTDNGAGTTTSPCTDDNQYCGAWAKSGYCLTNWYTQDHCKKSCNTCNATPRPSRVDENMNKKLASTAFPVSSTAVSTMTTVFSLIVAHVSL